MYFIIQISRFRHLHHSPPYLHCICVFDNSGTVMLKVLVAQEPNVILGTFVPVEHTPAPPQMAKPVTYVPLVDTVPQAAMSPNHVLLAHTVTRLVQRMTRTVALVILGTTA